MKSSFLFLFALFTSPVFSQVQFQNASFADALLQAKEQGKLIFLQLESPDCRQCTEVADKAFSDKELSAAINQTFVPLYINAKHPGRKWIETEYNSPNGFGTLFIDAGGTLIHKFSGTVSMPGKYREQIDIALNKAGENLKVSELEREYRNGNKSPGFLEQLLLKKKALGLNLSSLLDEYTSLLPADSLASVYTLQFIASLSPVLDTKADLAMRKNKELFNKAFNGLPITKRMEIGKWILENSLRKAVREKDEAYAMRVILFFKATNAPNQIAVERIYHYRLLDFYDRVDDTAKYLSTAALYYDRYLMTIDVDSIIRLDEKMREKLLETSKRDTVKTDKGFTVKTAIAYSPTAQRYTWDLKEGAWNFYKRTTDPTLLAKATEWVKKALRFSETYEALDVYARLLYKQNRKEQAIETEHRAIEVKKKQKYPVKDNEAVLVLMQQGLPLSD